MDFELEARHTHALVIKVFAFKDFGPVQEGVPIASLTVSGSMPARRKKNLCWRALGASRFASEIF